MLSPEVDLILVFKHMFNHLIGEGVGLRQVTDVAVLIRAYAPTLNISALREHLQNIGYLKAFDAMVALVGKYYNVSWDAYGDYLSSKDFRMADMLMADIMKNGNFGAFRTICWTPSEIKKFTEELNSYMAGQGRTAVYQLLCAVFL